MLKKQRALKILPAVQAGTQNKMAIQQGASLTKQPDQVFVGHGLGSARVSRAGFGEVRNGETPSPARETRALPGCRISARHDWVINIATLARRVCRDISG